MEFKINKGDKGKVAVKVDISAADFQEAYSAAMNTLGKDVKISGFRPGNIPADVLENNLGESKILNKAANFLVTQHLTVVFKQEKIIPLGNPSVAINKLTKGQPFSFTATVTSKPIVKMGDWKKVTITKVRPKAVIDKDVNDSILNIYNAWEKQQKAKGAEVVEEEKKKEEEGKFIYDAQGQKVYLKNEEKDKEEKTSKGDSRINDEFAKKIGARDVLHLRELVRVDLEKIVADQAEHKVEEELFTEMLKIGEVDVPDILVDDELNRIILRITQNLERQKRKMEDYLKQQQTTLDALKAKLRPQAEKNVQITLMMDEIGKAEGVKVLPEEVEKASQGVDQTKLSDKQKQDLKNYMTVSLFQSKTLKLVKEKVTGQSKPSPQKT